MKNGKTLILTIFLVLFGVPVFAADCNSGGRYEDIGNGTVQDCRSGLVWLKNANCTDSVGGINKSSGWLTWYDAMKWVAALGDGHCGLTDGSYAGDWRLPTKTELMAIIASAKKLFTNPMLTDESGTAHWTEGHPFNNVLSINYWSSVTSTAAPSLAGYVDLSGGSTYYYDKGATQYFYVWPVRGGQSGTFGNLILQ